VPPHQKRRVYVGLASLIVVLFIAGVISGWMGRHNQLCSDGKPPRLQQDTGLNQVVYLCHNGQVVTK
jgi:hypothetical protein